MFNVSTHTCSATRGAAVKGGGDASVQRELGKAALRYVPLQITSYFRGWKSIRHNYSLIVVGLLIHNCFQND